MRKTAEFSTIYITCYGLWNGNLRKRMQRFSQEMDHLCWKWIWAVSIQQQKAVSDSSCDQIQFGGGQESFVWTLISFVQQAQKCEYLRAIMLLAVKYNVCLLLLVNFYLCSLQTVPPGVHPYRLFFNQCCCYSSSYYYYCHYTSYYWSYIRITMVTTFVNIVHMNPSWRSIRTLFNALWSNAPRVNKIVYIWLEINFLLWLGIVPEFRCNLTRKKKLKNWGKKKKKSTTEFGKTILYVYVLLLWTFSSLVQWRELQEVCICEEADLQITWK